MRLSYTPPPNLSRQQRKTPSQNFHNLHTLKKVVSKTGAPSYPPPEICQGGASKNTPAGLAGVLVGVLVESANIARATHTRRGAAVGRLGGDDGAVHTALEGVVEDFAFLVRAIGDGDVAIGPDAYGEAAIRR